MKEKDSIKGKGDPEGGDQKIKRKTLQQSRTELVIKLENQYIRIDLLGQCRGRFFLD